MDASIVHSFAYESYPQVPSGSVSAFTHIYFVPYLEFCGELHEEAKLHAASTFVEKHT